MFTISLLPGIQRVPRNGGLLSLIDGFGVPRRTAVAPAAQPITPRVNIVRTTVGIFIHNILLEILCISEHTSLHENLSPTAPPYVWDSIALKSSLSLTLPQQYQRNSTSFRIW